MPAPIGRALPCSPSRLLRFAFCLVHGLMRRAIDDDRWTRLAKCCCNSPWPADVKLGAREAGRAQGGPPRPPAQLAPDASSRAQIGEVRPIGRGKRASSRAFVHRARTRRPFGSAISVRLRAPEPVPPGARVSKERGPLIVRYAFLADHFLAGMSSGGGSAEGSGRCAALLTRVPQTRE